MKKVMARYIEAFDAFVLSGSCGVVVKLCSLFGIETIEIRDGSITVVLKQPVRGAYAISTPYAHHVTPGSALAHLIKEAEKIRKGEVAHGQAEGADSSEGP
jgi:hypothetical protein